MEFAQRFYESEENKIVLLKEALTMHCNAHIQLADRTKVHMDHASSAR